MSRAQLFRATVGDFTLLVFFALFSEAVVPEVFCKNVFIKSSQNSHKNTFAGDNFQ